MAEVFLNRKSRNIGTSPVTLGGYVVASATVSTIIGLSVSNTTENLIKVSVSINDGTNDFFILKGADVVPGQAHAIIGGDQKVVMMTGDRIVVSSDTASSVDGVLSLIELTA